MQIVLTLLLFCFPLFVGFVFSRERELSLSGLIRCWIMGQFLQWAVFQVTAVPLVLGKSTFDWLFWVFLVLSVVLAVWGFVRVRKRKVRISLDLPKAPVMWIVLILAVGLILWQAGMYIFGVHLDEDDSRWIPQTNDALLSGKMFMHNPATGVYVGDFIPDLMRDLLSPWPMFLAYMCRFTGVSAAVMYHTIYAPVLLLIMYGIYALIARELFKGIDERIIFLFGIAVMNLFFAGNGYTQAMFSLERIWQGKATAAAILIPAILLQFLRIQREDTVVSWLELAVIGCAGCLFSGMGILIAVIAIGLYGLYVICCRRFRKIPMWLITLLCPVIYQLISLKIGGTAVWMSL